MLIASCTVLGNYVKLMWLYTFRLVNDYNNYTSHWCIHLAEADLVDRAKQIFIAS